MNQSGKFRASVLSAAVASTVVPNYAAAQEQLLEEVVVTATRRAESVQDIPLNITALSSNLIERERLSNISDIARRVPGMTLIDQGPRSGNILTVRGLNADSINQSENTAGNSGGNNVGIYVGEVPIYIDLDLNDLQRVEVLIGPQGTLYGSGTLAGAVRYIPNKPQPDALAFELRGDVYDLNESDDLGYETGATLNIPIIEDRLAVRANLDYTDDPGFIDYDFLVREAGVSNPQPDFSNPDEVRANLKKEADVNTVETTSGRIALRYSGDWLDGTLSYFYQDTEIGGRQVNHKDSFGTDDYVAAHRFVEPNDRKNELFTLELVADLGFAELTSATGYNEYTEQGQRDQTDLLLEFEAGYEFFPTFSSFTREDQEDEQFSQEIRLVSTGDGPWNWIVGAFYSKFEIDQLFQEFTPGYDQFLVDIGVGVQLRPDALEYYQTNDSEVEETAGFGELGYQITDAWQVTVGARWFKFEEDFTTAFALPLADTVFGGAPQDAIFPIVDQGDVDDDDVIYKFNTSYDFSDDMMAYLTVSEGYRLGGVNPIPPCTDIEEGQQNVCALPNEILIKADTTTNYELGMRSQWGDSVIFNGALYYIDWDDIQVADVTENGGVPIITNGSSAESLGVELSGQWYITDTLSLLGSYAYTEAELTDDAPGLVDGVDGEDGDRLPGSPEHQAYLALNYGLPLADGSDLEFDWSMTYTSDVLTKAGERNNGEELDGFALHNVSATWLKDSWRVTLYADNVFDEYAETGVRDDFSQVRQINGWDLRRYYHNVVRPRQIGMRLVYNFDG
jgi:outer membrane receptor protein involved in Fe transport